MMVADFTQKTKDLIDNLKGTCASYGLGNDGNESKIITQVFLYKFMNDKFGYDLKKIDDRFVSTDSWEKIASEMTESAFSKVTMKISPNTAKLKREHLLSYLYNQQNIKNFSKLFDSTLIDISQTNASIFSVSTANNSKIVLFDELSQFVSDSSQRDDFCRAIINQLVNFSFEEIFTKKFDFFSTIFEYLIKDYNKDGGGKYAEYYTPHAVSKIMAKVLVDSPQKNVSVYDPSAGSGTLLMNVAHEIGESNCSIYSQDVSQKSSGLLRLNLILNNLVHSIPNVIQGNTLTTPFFKDGAKLKKFDFIVSNPPFKLDFSDFRDELDKSENSERFFAGIPKVPAKKQDSMSIYLLFIQHIIFSLSPKGRAAIVVPTGFLSGKDAISVSVRKYLVNSQMIRGIISMPSNIFATTGTQVSVLFIDKSTSYKSVMLLDASNLGTKVKDGKNQKTLLSDSDENLIIETFTSNSEVKEFSVVVDSDKFSTTEYSLNPGQYFGVNVEFEPVTNEEFVSEVSRISKILDGNLVQAKNLNDSIKLGLKKISVPGKK